MLDKIKALILRLVLPKKQFYIQCDGFHSVFKPIMKPLIDVEDFDGESD